MLSFACRRFRAGFVPGSHHPHRRSCQECAAFAAALESTAGARLPLPPSLRRSLRAVARPETPTVLPFAAPRLAMPDALAGRLRAIASPPTARRQPIRPALPVWARSPRYAIAASALLTLFLGPFLSSAAQRGRLALEAVQTEVRPILERTGASAQQEAGKLRSTAAAAKRSVEGSLESLGQRVSRWSDAVPERFINLGSGDKPPEPVRRPQ
jgi:hypothetical protein